MSDPVSRLNAALEGRRVLLVASLFFLLLSCGDNDDPTVPTVHTLCSDQPETALATFEDAILEATVRRALGIGAQQDLTCGLASGLRILQNQGAEIRGLMGIQNLTSLTHLDLFANRIADISALSGLTSLTHLDLATARSPLNAQGNNIADISALSGLTSLTHLDIGKSLITDISALSGLTSLTYLDLWQNRISNISALSGLTSLTHLDLAQNPLHPLGDPLPGIGLMDIGTLRGLTSLKELLLWGNKNLSDIQPLLDNTGIGAGDRVEIFDTNVSCADLALLKAKGVDVSPGFDRDCNWWGCLLF